MKIVHVLDHSLPLQSGYVFRTLGLLNAQKQRGWTPVMLTTPRHNKYDKTWAGQTQQEFDGWSILRSPKAGSKIPVLNEWGEMQATYTRLCEVIEKHKPDILHAHSPVLNGLPALWAGKRYNIPVVYEVRAFWEDAGAANDGLAENSFRYRATKMLETHVLKKADAALFICEGLKSDAIKRGVSEEKMGIIPNAVNIDAFKKSSQPDAKLADELGLGDGPVLGFIGSFYHYEGLDYLVRALPQIRETLPTAKILLVGGGNESENLRQLAQTLNLSNDIVFTGRVPFAEVNKYYDLIDILVYPRRRIRLTDLVTPLKPLEAMAQERILAASDIGGHRELITDGQTGYLFEADNPAKLAAKVVEALNARSDWPQIKSNARRFVETERNWNASVENYVPIYTRLRSS